MRKHSKRTWSEFFLCAKMCIDLKISASLWQSKEVNAFTQSSTLAKPAPVSALLKASSGLVYCLVAVYWHGHYDWCLCHVKAGPAVQGEESSLLLSPSVFQHSVTKTAEPPTSPTADLPSSLYSRNQLKDTLVHLIKVQTDPRTLNQQWRKIILVFNRLPVCFAEWCPFPQCDPWGLHTEPLERPQQHQVITANWENKTCVWSRLRFTTSTTLTASAALMSIRFPVCCVLSRWAFPFQC